MGCWMGATSWKEGLKLKLKEGCKLRKEVSSRPALSDRVMQPTVADHLVNQSGM